MKRLIAIALVSVFCAQEADGQDFYDVDVLRTVRLDFHDVNWWQLLQQNYQSQTNILADMTVEGAVYPDVGVRIRGNTSYLALPPGSQKVSLAISVDHVHPQQDVMGHSTLNFNNAFSDATFCREVVYHNILARWIPSGRANHIVLNLNGENWGVYANIQQYGKKVLKEFFADADGLRVKCPNNPFGPGLQYAGTNPSSYGQYEIKDDGGLANPIDALIAICDAVDNTPAANFKQIDQTFAIDPSIWTVALENLLGDDDGYVNKGCDFTVYRDPVDGRAHLHQTDGNETFNHADWAADFHFNLQNKPVLNNVLRNATPRGRYFAHLRTVLFEELDPIKLDAEFTARRNLIDADVFADPKKIYTYQQFLDNFTMTVNLPGSPPFGGPKLGLMEYVNQKRTLLLADPEVTSPAPTIQNVTATDALPGQPVFISATVTGTDPVGQVTLYYRPSPEVQYELVAMADDGASGDGAAGDSTYGAQLPVPGTVGQQVPYYIGATSQNTYRSASFEPRRAEMDPDILTFAAGASDVVINEFLARNNSVIQDEQGSFEDYVELYNRGAAPVDVSGMYMSDSFSTPTEWQIPAGTVIAPGGTLLIWADEDLTDGPLHADFKLSTDGEEIGLWDTDGVTLLDGVTFGPQQIDVSTGRVIDGGDVFVTFPAPTPDAPNNPGCGAQEYDQLDPTAHNIDMVANGDGTLGTPLAFVVSGLQPSSTAFFALDFTAAHAPVSPSLVALVGGAVVISVPVTPAGSFVVPFFVPNNPTFNGLEFYVQSAGLDAGGVLSGSNAIRVTVCP